MDRKKTLRLLWIAAAVYWVMVLTVYFVAGEQFRGSHITGSTLSPAVAVRGLSDGVTVTQAVYAPADLVEGIEIFTGGGQKEGMLCLRLADAAGEELAAAAAEASGLENGGFTKVLLSEPVKTKTGERLQLTLWTSGCGEEAAVALYAGTAVAAGRFDAVQEIPQEDLVRVDGNPGAGRLCVKLDGYQPSNFHKVYWLIVCPLFAAAAVLCACWLRQGGTNPLCTAICLVTRYEFLVRQLVSRDFKAKYKRSTLGVAWSFLNPLLTMTVQYIVFSRLFRSDIPNYPVYLLTGIVFFGFFNEAASSGLTSVTQNAPLLKKVYLPKYIYPVSRVLSSTIQFLFSLLPIFPVMLLTGTAFRPSLVLLVYVILCLMVFLIGMSLILSTCMTFFQDTQFLWGVVSMIWMYLTPVFYPESIIPERLLWLYRLNPMNQYISFARTCIISGVSPAPSAYFACLAWAAGVLALGALVFKRNQDRLVLHL